MATAIDSEKGSQFGIYDILAHAGDVSMVGNEIIRAYWM